MNALIAAAFSRTSAILLTLVLLSAVGVASYIQIPKEARPDVDIPVAYVSVIYEGISPDDAERLLIKPLEKHLRTVEGLDVMKSVASEGYGSVALARILIWLWQMYARPLMKPSPIYLRMRMSQK